jgi:hypothetical protein
LIIASESERKKTADENVVIDFLLNINNSIGICEVAFLPLQVFSLANIEDLDAPVKNTESDVKLPMLTTSGA